MEKYIDLKTDLNYERLKEPAKIIRDGGIVIFPTETVYGIGTNGLDEKAIKKIYEVKQRSFNKPISLLVNNIEMVNKIAKNISKLEYKIMESFFPGPLTIILEKRDIIPNILVIANTNTAPNTYGPILFLYSALSSALPIIYFIPKMIKTITDNIDPAICKNPIISLPISLSKFALLALSELAGL